MASRSDSSLDGARDLEEIATTSSPNIIVSKRNTDGEVFVALPPSGRSSRCIVASGIQCLSSANSSNNPCSQKERHIDHLRDTLKIISNNSQGESPGSEINRNIPVSFPLCYNTLVGEIQHLDESIEKSKLPLKKLHTDVEISNQNNLKKSNSLHFPINEHFSGKDESPCNGFPRKVPYNSVKIRSSDPGNIIEDGRQVSIPVSDQNESSISVSDITLPKKTKNIPKEARKSSSDSRMGARKKNMCCLKETETDKATFFSLKSDIRETQSSDGIDTKFFYRDANGVHIVSRLMQIKDYIKQTSKMIERLSYKTCSSVEHVDDIAKLEELRSNLREQEGLYLNILQNLVPISHDSIKTDFQISDVSINNTEGNLYLSNSESMKTIESNDGLTKKDDDILKKQAALLNKLISQQKQIQTLQSRKQELQELTKNINLIIGGTCFNSIEELNESKKEKCSINSSLIDEESPSGSGKTISLDVSRSYISEEESTGMHTGDGSNESNQLTFSVLPEGSPPAIPPRNSSLKLNEVDLPKNNECSTISGFSLSSQTPRLHVRTCTNVTDPYDNRARAESLSRLPSVPSDNESVSVGPSMSLHLISDANVFFNDQERTDNSHETAAMLNAASAVKRALAERGELESKLQDLAFKKLQMDKLLHALNDIQSQVYDRELNDGSPLNNTREKKISDLKDMFHSEIPKESHSPRQVTKEADYDDYDAEEGVCTSHQTKTSESQDFNNERISPWFNPNDYLSKEQIVGLIQNTSLDTILSPGVNGQVQRISADEHPDVRRNLSYPDECSKSIQTVNVGGTKAKKEPKAFLHTNFQPILGTDNESSQNRDILSNLTANTEQDNARNTERVEEVQKRLIHLQTLLMHAERVQTGFSQQNEEPVFADSQSSEIMKENEQQNVPFSGLVTDNSIHDYPHNLKVNMKMNERANCTTNMDSKGKLVNSSIACDISVNPKMKGGPIEKNVRSIQAKSVNQRKSSCKDINPEKINPNAESVKGPKQSEGCISTSSDEIWLQMRQHQILREELRARRRELERLMGKDGARGMEHFYSRNQDISDNFSMSLRSEPVAASTLATWGGSTEEYNLDDGVQLDSNSITIPGVGFTSPDFHSLVDSGVGNRNEESIEKLQPIHQADNACQDDYNHSVLLTSSSQGDKGECQQDINQLRITPSVMYDVDSSPCDGVSSGSQVTKSELPSCEKLPNYQCPKCPGHTTELSDVKMCRDSLSPLNFSYGLQRPLPRCSRHEKSSFSCSDKADKNKQLMDSSYVPGFLNDHFKETEEQKTQPREFTRHVNFESESFPYSQLHTKQTCKNYKFFTDMIHSLTECSTQLMAQQESLIHLNQNCHLLLDSLLQNSYNINSSEMGHSNEIKANEMLEKKINYNFQNPPERYPILEPLGYQCYLHEQFQSQCQQSYQPYQCRKKGNHKSSNTNSSQLNENNDQNILKLSKSSRKNFHSLSPDQFKSENETKCFENEPNLKLSIKKEFSVPCVVSQQFKKGNSNKEEIFSDRPKQCVIGNSQPIPTVCLNYIPEPKNLRHNNPFNNSNSKILKKSSTTLKINEGNDAVKKDFKFLFDEGSIQTKNISTTIAGTLGNSKKKGNNTHEHLLASFNNSLQLLHSPRNEINQNSVFGILRESIYSEVASLISLNETRPSFLLELFKDLQLLSTDHLRQEIIQTIRILVANHLKECASKNEQVSSDIGSHFSENFVKSVAPTKTIQDRPKKDLRFIKPNARHSSNKLQQKTINSELTPSESLTLSEDIEITPKSNNFIRENKKDILHDTSELQLTKNEFHVNNEAYDYSEYVDNGSILSTPVSPDEPDDTHLQHTNDPPFASESLGDTVIHLDKAMKRMKEFESELIKKSRFSEKPEYNPNESILPKKRKKKIPKCVKEKNCNSKTLKNIVINDERDSSQAIESGSSISVIEDCKSDYKLNVIKSNTEKKMRKKTSRCTKSKAKDMKTSWSTETSEITSSSSAHDRGSDSSSDSFYAKINAKDVDTNIQSIMATILPKLNSHLDEVCSQEFLTDLHDLIICLICESFHGTPCVKTTRHTDQSSQGTMRKTRFENSFLKDQLGSILMEGLNKFSGRKLRECLEDLLADISELLFNEFAFYHLMKTQGEQNSTIEMGENNQSNFQRWNRYLNCNRNGLEKNQININTSSSSSACAPRPYILNDVASSSSDEFENINVNDNIEEISEEETEIGYSTEDTNENTINETSFSKFIRQVSDEEYEKLGNDRDDEFAKEIPAGVGVFTITSNNRPASSLRMLSTKSEMDVSVTQSEKFTDPIINAKIMNKVSHSPFRYELAVSETKPYHIIGSDEDDEELCDQTTECFEPLETAVSHQSEEAKPRVLLFAKTEKGKSSLTESCHESKKENLSSSKEEKDVDDTLDSSICIDYNISSIKELNDDIQSEYEVNIEVSAQQVSLTTLGNSELETNAVEVRNSLPTLFNSESDEPVVGELSLINLDHQE